MLTRAQYEIASQLLERAVGWATDPQLLLTGNYELPMEPEMVEFANEYERWSVRNAEAPAATVHVFDASKRLVLTDVALMSFLAAKLEEEQSAWEVADHQKADSIDALIPSMDRDLDELRKRWASYAKNVDGTDDQGRVVNVLVAAHVATKKFAMVAEHYARPVFNGQRNEWRQIEKSIDDAVASWLKRPADGSLGLRRVK